MKNIGNKSIVSLRNSLDGTYASKAFDFIFLEQSQEDFQSSKNQLKEINNRLFSSLLESAEAYEKEYQQRKNNYLSQLYPGYPNSTKEEVKKESEIASETYDELYQAQLKEMLKEECEEYEKKAKKFATAVEQNLETANKSSSPSHPDMVCSAVLMMTPFGLFAVFDYFDQLQQVYEVVQPAIDGLQTAFENVPFIGDLMKEFYGISGSEFGSSATAFAGSLSNDFLLKSAISYFAAKRMAVKLIDSYDDKKQNFDSAIKKVEDFNSALTNQFKNNKLEITNRVLKNCGLYDVNDPKAIKQDVTSKQEAIKLRNDDVKSFNKKFFAQGADKNSMIKDLLKFKPEETSEEQKKAFIEKAWIVFFAEKTESISEAQSKIKLNQASDDENQSYFNQIGTSDELAIANKLAEIKIAKFDDDQELRNKIKDLRLIQGKAMLVGGLQNDSAEFLTNLLPNQKIETLDSKDFESKTLEDGKIYNTKLENLSAKDLEKISALILHEGSKDQGHYTALIKQKIFENGQEKLVWFHYDDDKIDIKNDGEMQSILKNKTVTTVVNSSKLPIAKKGSSEEIKPAFDGLKNTGNSCFANSAVALVNSLPADSVISKEFRKNLDKVGLAPDLGSNDANIGIASEHGSINNVKILELQNKFIAKKSARGVAEEIGETNEVTKQNNPSQQQNIITSKQSFGKQK